MHFVRGVSYVSEYQLILTIEDGSKKIVDLERYLEGEMFDLTLTQKLVHLRLEKI